jgi:hypothetical protein
MDLGYIAGGELFIELEDELFPVKHTNVLVDGRESNRCLSIVNDLLGMSREFPNSCILATTAE